MKKLTMKKEVGGINFEALRRMTYGRIRAMGWWRGLRITFPKANYSVRVYSQNCLSSAWENPCIYCLCHVTILPCIFMRMYRDCNHHASNDLRSHFQIPYAAIQVFSMIENQLWCPGFSGMDLAQELLRDVFW